MVLPICMYTCILLRAIQIDVQYVEKDVQSMTEALYTINGEVWMDLGGIIVELYSHTQRICCKEHGIKTASVPWAYPSSRFTKDFDMTATFLAMNINRKVASEYLRCDWHTIMRCISRARSVLEPDIKKRYDGLVNIGIDETSYRKGHNYVTTVVNHDTNSIE